MPNFCKHCGAEIKDAKFCPNCGNAVDGEKTAPPTAELSPQSDSTKNVQQDLTSKPKKNGCCLKYAIALFVLAMIIAIIGGLFAPSSTDRKAKPNAGNSASMSAEDQKKAAGDFDANVWGLTAELIKTQNNMMSGMESYANGTMAAVDLYDYCNKVNDSLVKFKAPDSSNDSEKTYAGSCKDYAVYVQITAKSLAKYLNDSSTSNLSKLKNDISLMNQAASVVANNRGVFLVQAGFSDDEIQEKVAAMDEDLAQ